jgi:GNAT superfamily N-acetyltransferase
MQEPVLAYGFHEHDRAAIIDILREYESALGVSLCFQDFDRELAALPGDYASPTGELILARDPASNAIVGCVALKAVSGAADACEMKRMYVRPVARGAGLGRMLALAVLDAGRRLGYARMCLDTLPHLHAAQTLYSSLGFRQTGVSTSEPRVLLFEKEL